MSLPTVTQLPVAHQPRELALPEPVSHYGAPPPPEDEGLDFRRVLGAVKRRKYFILAIVLLLTALAYLFVRQITPIYEARVTLLIENDRGTVIGPTVLTPQDPDLVTRETEAAVLKSRQTATRVVEALRLTENPLFNPTLVQDKPSVLESIFSGISSLFGGGSEEAGGAEAALAERMVAEGEDPNAVTSTLTEAEIREMVVDNFLGGLTVRPSDRARVIEVIYASSDRALATRIANTIAEVYISGQVTTESAAVGEASRFVGEQLAEAEARLREAQDALAEFQRTTPDIINVGDNTLLTRQLAELSADLIVARNDLQAAQSAYNQVQGLIGSGRSIDSVPAVMDSLLIARLQEQANAAQARVAELRTRYGSSHPELRSAEAELGNIQGAIGAEVRKIALRLENDLQLARERAAALEAEVSRLEDRLENQTGEQAQLRRLQDAVDSANAFYQQLLTRSNEVQIEAAQQRQAPAQVISEAVVPDQPAYPNTKLILAAAVAGSAVVGILLALLAEFMDNGFRSMTQIESMTGAPALGLMPITKGGKEPHLVALHNPNSAYGEAVRSLRTALLLSSADRPPRTVCVTSSLPDEGKTSTALSIAILAARSGQKAVILDCDLRRPSVHKVLGRENNLGLSDYLTGKAKLEQVLEIDPESDLHYITAGSKTPNPPELLQSGEMHKLIDELGGTFDLVILDTPPLMAVSDAMLLLRRCDKTIYVVRWEKTRRQTAIAGVRQAYDAGGDLAGVLLTQVNARKMAQYDYADSGYYYASSYKKYYADDR